MTPQVTTCPCLIRVPEYVELGGELSATFICVADSYSGSMAITAAVTPIAGPLLLGGGKSAALAHRFL